MLLPCRARQTNLSPTHIRRRTVCLALSLDNPPPLASLIAPRIKTSPHGSPHLSVPGLGSLAVSLSTVGESCDLTHGSVVIASITSCTNTSNPSVMMAAGLVAKRAVELGLKVPESIKTSLAPGSQVVSGYLKDAGLTPFLDQLGFHTVGYGCMTCVGNSGEIDPEVLKIPQLPLITALNRLNPLLQPSAASSTNDNTGLSREPPKTWVRGWKQGSNYRGHYLMVACHKNVHDQGMSISVAEITE